MYQNHNFKSNEIIEYLRKSRADDPYLTVEEVLARHETILNDWITKNLSEPVPDENIYREVVSGETIDDRPEMLKLLKRIESPAIKAILVVEVQRLSRGDLEDAGRLIKILRYTGTKVITPVKTYDLSDDYDRDFFERELKRGNEYLEYQKKIMGRGRALSASQGNYITSVAPFGYDRIWLIEGKKKVPSLAINETEAEGIRFIFDAYVNKDMRMPSIANALNNMGIKPRKSPFWERSSIRDILSNPVYMGKIRWEYRKTHKIIEDGIVLETRPKRELGEYPLFDGRHEAIISEELFNAAQAKHGRIPRVKSELKVRNPLAGILYCRACGKALVYQGARPDRGCRARLICSGQSHCKTASALYDVVLEQIIQILHAQIADFKIQIENKDNAAVGIQANILKQLDKKYKDLELKEIKQWEKYSEEGMPKAIFDKLNEKVLAEKEETLLAIKNVKNNIPDYEDYEEKIFRFSETVKELMDEDVEPAVKNKLIKSCIERIEYEKDVKTAEIKLFVTLSL